MSLDEAEKVDGMEIVSVGSLYRGPWNKKYWSCSRGKDRYPYPLGYHVLRTHAGITYRMEIQEGLKGPLFVISSMTGESFSGLTPDITWELFQRGRGPHAKPLHGKRFSCKMDGIELFGFRNPLIQRLLRELVANENEMTVQSSDVPDLCIDKSELELETWYPNSGACPNFLSYLGKFRSTRKRSWKCRDMNNIASSRCFPKRFDSAVNNENIDVEETRLLSYRKRLNSGCSLHATEFPLQSWNVQADSAPLLSRRYDTSLLRVDLLVPKAADHSGEASGEVQRMTVHQETEGMCVPSFLEGDPFSSSAVAEHFTGPAFVEDGNKFDSSSNVDLQNVDSKTSRKEIEVPLSARSLNISATCVPDSLEGRAMVSNVDEAVGASGTSNSNSEKNDYDSIGQETASMMSLLLPRALPLLKKTYRRKKTKANLAAISSKYEYSENLAREMAPAIYSLYSTSVDKSHAIAGDIISDASCSKNENLGNDDLFVPDSIEDIPQAGVIIAADVKGDKDSLISHQIGGCLENFSLPSRSKMCMTGHEGVVPRTYSSMKTTKAVEIVSDTSVTNTRNHDYRGSGELPAEVESVAKLVGCYMHPVPILFASLRMIANDIHVCVVCGFSTVSERVLFLYKVLAEPSSSDSPAFMGYTAMVPKGTLTEKTVCKNFGLQFAPSTYHLVLLDAIKTPLCSAKSISCSCTKCSMYDYEDSAVKIVSMELGYVQLVNKLRTDDRICCILVCEPNYLVVAGEGGRLHAWVMNLTWSTWEEEFNLPNFSSASPIEELKVVANSASLIIGHNGIGGFGLWDLSKRYLVASFHSSGSSISHVVPVNCFMWKTDDHIISHSKSAIISEIMAETKMRLSFAAETRTAVPSNVDDVALWLLICTGLEDDTHDIPTKSWKLALLARNMVFIGAVLDPSALSANISGGRGIIGTRYGLTYIWEFSSGTKLLNLHYIKGRSVTHIVTDADTGVFAVGYEDGCLLIYTSSLGSR